MEKVTILCKIAKMTFVQLDTEILSKVKKRLTLLDRCNLKELSKSFDNIPVKTRRVSLQFTHRYLCYTTTITGKHQRGNPAPENRFTYKIEDNSKKDLLKTFKSIFQTIKRFKTLDIRLAEDDHHVLVLECLNEALICLSELPNITRYIFVYRTAFDGIINGTAKFIDLISGSLKELLWNCNLNKTEHQILMSALSHCENLSLLYISTDGRIMFTEEFKMAISRLNLRKIFLLSFGEPKLCDARSLRISLENSNNLREIMIMENWLEFFCHRALQALLSTKIKVFMVVVHAQIVTSQMLAAWRPFYQKISQTLMPDALIIIREFGQVLLWPPVQELLPYFINLTKNSDRCFNIWVQSSKLSKQNAKEIYYSFPNEVRKGISKVKKGRKNTAVFYFDSVNEHTILSYPLLDDDVSLNALE